MWARKKRLPVRQDQRVSAWVFISVHSVADETGKRIKSIFSIFVQRVYPCHTPSHNIV